MGQKLLGGYAGLSIGDYLRKVGGSQVYLVAQVDSCQVAALGLDSANRYAPAVEVHSINRITELEARSMLGGESLAGWEKVEIDVVVKS